MSYTGPLFPNIAATSRSLTVGDYPGTSFRSQNGAEVRVQYGNRRVGTELSFTFSNITDANAALIHDHYNDCRGTLGVFGVDRASLTQQGNPGFHDGTTPLSVNNRFSAAPWGLRYRYAEPPQFDSIKPGRMSVTVKLTGVLDS
jgi:hypothetical protein